MLPDRWHIRRETNDNYRIFSLLIRQSSRDLRLVIRNFAISAWTGPAGQAILADMAQLTFLHVQHARNV